MNIFARIGRAVMTVLAHIGALALFTGKALAGIVSPPIYFRLILIQIMRIGYYSLPVVGLTAFFMGGVLALQIYLGGNRFGAEAIVPQVVVLGAGMDSRPWRMQLREGAWGEDPWEEGILSFWRQFDVVVF